MSGPWQRDFDAARDPYAARNALGITGQIVYEAPQDGTAYERKDGAWVPASGGGGGGNVSNSGTPTSGQYAKWVTATTIQGVAPSTVLSDAGGITAAAVAAGYQPLDADLTSLAAASATNTIYYRSAANTWSTVTVGTGLSFSGGTLTNTAAAPTLPTQQVFVSGSGTYTTPASCRRIEIRMSGGGGGGGGSGTPGAGAATAGTASTFGSSLLVANGGGGGGDRSAGAGGSASLGGASGVGITGTTGGCGAYNGTSGGVQQQGGSGASSPWGGGGGGGAGSGTNGTVGSPGNYGAGGGGAGAGAGSYASGGGGGAGGYIEAFINSPAATYSYTVGALGAGGGAASGGVAGGAGGPGIIWVKEFY